MSKSSATERLIMFLNIYYTWKDSSGSTLQCALCKIKIRLLESDQKCLSQGSSTKSLLSLCKKDNIRKFFFEK